MSSRSGDGHFIGIDWGSTNARALLFAPDGRLVDERNEPLGIKQVRAGGYPAAFDRLAGDWRQRHGTIPTFLSGMVGSRTGWHEAPYLACPANLSELHRSLLAIPGTENVFVVPGLSLDGERADVMRGEELQLLGLGGRSADFDWICIPGTHSKWVRAGWPLVREFHTAMTGEVFAAIAEHTLFAKLIPVAPNQIPAFLTDAFDAGLERSAASHGVLNALFAIRADALLGRVDATEIADLISGLIIGTEIRHVLAQAPGRSRLALLAAPGLQARYLRALANFGFVATAFDVKQVTADGFVALRDGLR
jgi:2-dehydro-3-deoxygalactonokinase